MKDLGHWLTKRASLLGEIQKLEIEVGWRAALLPVRPVRQVLPPKKVRRELKRKAVLKPWRLAYNSWRYRSKAQTNKIKQLNAAYARLDYIDGRIRLLTKTKIQLLKEDPFT